MRIAIISDIHGNCVAFDAVLADLRRDPTDHVVCLGDAVQGGPQPSEVVSRLRALACPVVMGNADAWLLTGEETGKEEILPERRRKLDEVRAWSLAQLSSDDRAFIGRFQPTVTLPLGRESSLLCFHGSPASYDEIILPHTSEEEFQGFLGAFASQILTGGHTHLQQIWRIKDSFFFNPGSVGLAYSHQQPKDNFRLDPWAEYAILTARDTGIGLEFRRVFFNVTELIHVYQECGRPYADEMGAQYSRDA